MIPLYLILIREMRDTVICYRTLSYEVSTITHKLLGRFSENLS